MNLQAKPLPFELDGGFGVVRFDRCSGSVPLQPL